MIEWNPSAANVPCIQCQEYGIRRRPDEETKQDNPVQKHPPILPIQKEERTNSGNASAVRFIAAAAVSYILHIFSPHRPIP